MQSVGVLDVIKKKDIIYDDSNSESENNNSDSEIDEMDDDDVPDDFDPLTFFKSQKQLCYYKMIDKYFKKCSFVLREKMVKIINSESIISLRVLEWVVTKSNNKGINIKLTDNEYYSINIMYKAQLKSYKKKNFDFFRRDRKFRYVYDKENNKKVITTLGQLNFFKWALSNNIIDYVEKHYDDINNAMIKYNKDEKIKKIEKKKKKKLEIKTNKNNDVISISSNSSDRTINSGNSNSNFTSKSSNLCLDANKFTISFD
jgi:hypothetical protein